MRDEQSQTPLPGMPGTSGQLRDTRLPKLLWALTAVNASGCLKVQNGNTEKRVWFTEGQPVFARSNLSDDRLTDRLLGRGLLSRAQYEAAQELIANKGSRRSGEVLVEAQLISQNALDEALQEHLLHMFDSMFLWADGEWSFDSEDLCDEAVTLGSPTAVIIMDAARHRIALSELWTAVGEPSLRPKLRDPKGAESLIDGLGLLPTEGMWLRRFDGSQSLEQMLGEWDTDERELLSVVFTLGLLDAFADT
ncbi:MAG TPA: DUF4388 domain-containing protein [Nannocystis exedens]|nr:DUF4388 domain-containing protein [Nannocystis exedens]